MSGPGVAGTGSAAEGAELPAVVRRPASPDDSRDAPEVDLPAARRVAPAGARSTSSGMLPLVTPGATTSEDSEVDFDLPTLGERIHGKSQPPSTSLDDVADPVEIPGTAPSEVGLPATTSSAPPPVLGGPRPSRGKEGIAGRPPAAGAARADEASAGALELDDDLAALPARPVPRDGGFSGELDLPQQVRRPVQRAPAAHSGADLPSPADEVAPSPPSDGGLDIDLVGDDQWQLPETASARPARGGADVASSEPDLPSPGGVGLPSPGGGSGGPSADDWPALAGELPSVGADLPSVGADLPSVGSDLPSVGSDLPSVGGSLPAPAESLPAVSDSLPALGSEVQLPQSGPSGSSQPNFQGIEPVSGHPHRAADGSATGHPTFAAGLGVAAGAASAGSARAEEAGLGGAGFGELDLGGEPEPLDHDPFGGGAQATGGGAAEVVRGAGGGAEFGEVNLGGDDQEPPIATAGSSGASSPPAPGGSEADEDMEFGAIPQESDSPPLPGPSLEGQQGAVVPPEVRARRRRRRLVAALGMTAVVGVGGGTLAMVPTIGPFGVYFISDQLKSAEHEALVHSSVQRVRSRLQQDNFSDFEASLKELERAMKANERVRALDAYWVFAGQLGQLRFGGSPKIKARADVLLKELEEQEELEYLELARAAADAADGRLARARQSLAHLPAPQRHGADATVLAAELELAAGNDKAALSRWQEVESAEHSARAAYGLARAQRLAGDMVQARKSAELVRQRNPQHFGARLLEVEALWRIDGDATKALEEGEKLAHAAKAASDEERIDTYTLLGDIHLDRSHITASEAAYSAALKIRPQAAQALAGLGDALYRAGRYSEALARFEAAVQARPEDPTPALGAAKTKIALEKLRDASDMLKKLREMHPEDALVRYWYGRAEEALGNREQAEKAYRQSIELPGVGSHAVDAYVALALLMNQQGRRDEAQKTLEDAKAKLGETAEVRGALGQLALAQGRYVEALRELKKAAALSPRDLGIKFNLGVAMRKNRHFDEAQGVLDEVAKVDRDFPGLALERGLLYEASGRSEEALKMYESALAKAPDDPDLMLRVGCGKVAAGSAEKATALLEKVLAQRPSSAETHHCLGRALLIEGTNLSRALTILKRAVDLDPNRPEYHLYVGWAANEAGRVAEAEKYLRQALSLDQGLADAYWQRGVLRYRQGAVRDAVQDLTKALELRPSRAEARAALADSYYDLGRERDAIEQWRQAVAAQPDNATWRYRFGRLLAQNRISGEAKEQLSAALKLVEADESQPRWVWEAHRLLARAIGSTKEAIPHWEAFLRMAPRDNAYREEAMAELKALGRPWSGM